MNPAINPIETFESIYKEWEGDRDIRKDIERHLLERPRFLGMIEDALRRCPEGARAAELGCGTAIDSCILAGRHPGIRFYGVDITQGSLALASRFSDLMDQTLRLIRGDVFRLPFREGAFSLIFHQGLVEHFRDPFGMMEEQARLLAPGGTVVISVPQRWTGYTFMKNRRIRKGTWPWGWETSYTGGSLEALARRVGLEPIGRLGEGYWRSWGEPAWVLRDLYGKFHRRNPLRDLPPFSAGNRIWESAWRRLEEAGGHLFCKNIVVSFLKPGPEEPK